MSAVAQWVMYALIVGAGVLTIKRVAKAQRRKVHNSREWAMAGDVMGKLDAAAERPTRWIMWASDVIRFGVRSWVFSRSNACDVCGRPLTDPESQRAHRGPECAAKRRTRSTALAAGPAGYRRS